MLTITGLCLTYLKSGLSIEYMHPEIEGTIRETAWNYFVARIQSPKDAYLEAAEAGKISFHDLYFMGVIGGAGSVALKGLIGIKQAPVIEHEEAGIPVVMQDDPEFRSRESDLTYRLTAELYGCTPAEAASRWDDIQSNVTQYVNDRSRKS